MSVGTTAATTTDGDDDSAGATELGEAAPYCAACGTWAGMFAPGEGWRHARGNPAPNGTRSPFDPGHEVELAWCVPPACSVSPAQLEQLLAALDDAIAYREHASASGYATAYRVLRRQLAAPPRPMPRTSLPPTIIPGPGRPPGMATPAGRRYQSITLGELTGGPASPCPAAGGSLTGRRRPPSLPGRPDRVVRAGQSRDDIG